MDTKLITPHKESHTEKDNQEAFLNDLQVLGEHFIIDIWGSQNFENESFIKQALIDAAKAAEAQLLHIHLHKFSEGGGVTGVALLAESHISIHTWPEYEYAAFDIFMCGNSKPELAVKMLESAFKPERIDVQKIERGKVYTKN